MEQSMVLCGHMLQRVECACLYVYVRVHTCK